MIYIQYLLKYFTPQIQLCPDWLFKSNWYSWYPRTFHQQVLSKSKQKSETELYLSHLCHIKECMSKININSMQGCTFRLMCSHRELTKDHVLTCVYVKIFRTVTRNAVHKSVWRKKDCGEQENISMFSTCSELTPRAPIPDGRMERIMHYRVGQFQVCVSDFFHLLNLGVCYREKNGKIF